MEKRLLLAIIASAVILFAYQMLFYKPQVQKSTEKIPLEKKLSISQDKTETLMVLPSSVKEEPQKSTLFIPKDELHVKTNLLDIKLDEFGRLNSWQMLNFGEKDSRRVDLIPPVLKKSPLSLKLGGNELIPIKFLSPASNIKEFIYEGYGLRITKRFTFAQDTYLVDLDIIVENPTSQALQVMKANGVSLQWEVPSAKAKEVIEAQKYNSHLDTIEQSCLINQKKKVIKYKQNGFLDGILAFLGFIAEPEPTDEAKREVGSIDWVSQSSEYFLNVLIPEKPLEEVIFNKSKEGELVVDVPLDDFILSPGQSITTSFKLYGGPKDYKILEGISSKMKSLTDMWAVPLVLLWILNFFYKITHNYGVAIILLTIVIKIIIHPLTKKNFKTMKGMQKLQPEMVKLKEKHKEDKEALNKEIMDLYKRHKVNPLGGCLPLLLQMPIFFALFTTLRSDIELRGAGFIFWLQDLSTKDPYFILPILMGVTMIIQQRMTPSPDPNQAKIGMFMSIFMTFMFINFPSGLVLYWLTQNILTIGEQILIDRGLEK